MPINLPLKQNKKMNNLLSDLKNILHISESQKLVDEPAFRKDGKRVEKIITRNPDTNEIVKITYFDFFNDKKIKSVEEFVNGEKIRETNYSLFKSVTEYDFNTGKKIRTTNFNPNNQTCRASSYDYDTRTGKIVRMSVFRADGKNLAFIKEISPETGLVTRCINYKMNSPAISSVAKFDFLDNTTIKTTYYYNTPIHINNSECLDKKTASDNINKKVINDVKNNKIDKLIDKLYKNKVSFSMINNS